MAFAAVSFHGYAPLPLRPAFPYVALRSAASPKIGVARGFLTGIGAAAVAVVGRIDRLWSDMHLGWTPIPVGSNRFPACSR